jgi:uncharacterized membrane protein YhaH (DUF805 family)
MEQAKVGGRTNHRLGWALIAVWALLALLLDLFWIDLYDRFWVIAFVLPATLWLGIAGLAGSIAVRALRDRAWAAPMILLAAVASVGTLQGLAGERIGLLARFHTLRPRYQAIVADIQAGRVPPRGSRYLIGRRSPVQCYAFQVSCARTTTLANGQPLALLTPVPVCHPPAQDEFRIPVWMSSPVCRLQDVPVQWTLHLSTPPARSPAPLSSPFG